MSIRRVITCFLVVALVSLRTIVDGAPKRVIRSVIPLWHLPCGDPIDEASNSGDTEDGIRVSLESIKLQHQLTLNDYLNRDYEYLYESVRIGVHDHQYIPNWVPGRRDVNAVKNLSHESAQTIANHLPRMHLDMQKFAVAFEQMLKDEPNSRIKEALISTQGYVTMMLCEIETNIASLSFLRMPARIERSIMSTSEREPVDVTRRLVRDWGIVLKYRDYLHAWRHVFDY